uniref:RNA polymerase sigma-70 factor n=1 Tax=Pedobacter schmidteae TaxID=2201271 RepID=UPI000EAE4FC8|nr:RNA polymerase sigma-70 factor [Pedobacter schmidteae]
MSTVVLDFKQLYLDFYAALCYFAFKIVGDQEEAKDIVEDVFVKVLHHKSIISADENIRAYLYTAVKNSCLSYLKVSARVKERQWHYNANQPSEEGDYMNDLIQAEVLREVMKVIDKLPGHSGKIIKMSYFDNLKNDEIAALLGISTQTVKNLKSKGLDSLRRLLKPDVFAMFLFLYGLKSG